jgi:sterol 3beta-glucosyltransferase
MSSGYDRPSPVNLTIIAFGTRGDVQPVLALARGLRARGLRVRMVASRHFAGWIEKHGIEAAPSDVDVHALMTGEGGRDWVAGGRNELKQLQTMKRLVAEYGPAIARDSWRACEGADAIASSFTSDICAASVAEKLGVPHISTPLQPALVATRSGATTIGAPLPGRDSWINFVFGKLLIEPFGWRLTGSVNNRFRQELLGLAPQTRAGSRRQLRRMLTVQGFSAHVVPHPPDWPANIHTAGYWFLDEDPGWQPPASLAEFLGAGQAPVFIGFGSMTGREPEEATRLIIKAVALSGTRAVVQAGWAGLGGIDLPPTIYRLDSAPHHWLFPRMRAVVHHGGAGTTGEGLRAGVPTVIVPHMTDQPFWGARVEALGVGPRAIPRHRLTADNLAAALRAAVTDAGMAAAARDLGARIRAEDGVSTAVALIESHLAAAAPAASTRGRSTSAAGSQGRPGSRA